MGILDNLTPKKILLSTLREKLEDTGIRKIVLVFNIETEHYNVMLSTEDNKSMKVDITADEITTLKKLFIRRIVAKWNEKYDEDVKAVVIEVDFAKTSEELRVFIQSKNDETFKFDYL